MYYLEDNMLIEKIIFYTITEEEIKNHICEQMMKLIEKHLEKDWDWCELSCNPNVTIEYVEKHPENPWDWDELSVNPSATMEYVEKHPEKPWNWFELSQNPNMTMEYVEKHPDKSWNWGRLSENLFNREAKVFREKLNERINFNL